MLLNLNTVISTHQLSALSVGVGAYYQYHIFLFHFLLHVHICEYSFTPVLEPAAFPAIGIIYKIIPKTVGKLHFAC